MFLLEHKNIQGTTTLGTYKECVKLDSITFKAGTSQKNVCSTTSRPSGINFDMIGEIYCTRTNDVSSVNIFRQAIKTDMFPVKIICLETNNRPYLILELEDCLVNQYELIGHGYPAIEKFYLTFSKINYRYLPLNGSPTGCGYDLTAGKLL